MAVVELEALSGYQVDPDEVQKLVDSSAGLRKVEVENKDTKLVTYFDEVSPRCRMTSSDHSVAAHCRSQTLFCSRVSSQ